MSTICTIKYFSAFSIKVRGSSSAIFKIFSIKFLGKSLITFEFISVIISKINQNNFGKSDFDNLSNKENIPIKTISLKNQSDDQVLKKELINQIYSFSEKKVIVVHDIEFAENFLIYIDKIENVTIDENSQEYEKYLNLSKLNIANELYNTYDSYIKKRYKIDINYQALNTVKNYFN